MAQFSPLERSNRYNFKNLKIQDGGSRHLEKSKNRQILATVRPILTKFGMVTHFDRLEAVDNCKFEILRIQ